MSPSILPLQLIPDYWKTNARPIAPNPFPRPTHCMSVPAARYKCSNMFITQDSLEVQTRKDEDTKMADPNSDFYRNYLRYATCLGSYKQELMP